MKNIILFWMNEWATSEWEKVCLIIEAKKKLQVEIKKILSSISNSDCKKKSKRLARFFHLFEQLTKNWADHYANTNFAFKYEININQIAASWLNNRKWFSSCKARCYFAYMNVKYDDDYDWKFDNISNTLRRLFKCRKLCWISFKMSHLLMVDGALMKCFCRYKNSASW